MLLASIHQGFIKDGLSASFVAPTEPPTWAARQSRDQDFSTLASISATSTASGAGEGNATLFSPGTHCMEKSRSSRRKAATAVFSTPGQERRSSPHEKGGAFVSDVLSVSPTFLSLYEHDRVTEDQLDDFITAWHETGDEEQRSLAEYLGMTNEEYSVSLMAPDSLPLIRRARREHLPLRELLVPWLDELRSTGDPMDRPVIHALSHWLGQPDAC